MCSILCLSIAALVWATQLPTVTSDVDPPDAKTLAEWKKYIADSGPLYEQGHISETARVLEKAVHAAEHLPALDPRLPSTIHALGFMYQEQGNYAQATRMYLRAIRLWERIGPSQHDALLRSTDNLIGTYVEAHDYRAASKLLTARLPEMEQSATDWRAQATFLNMRSSLAYMDQNYGETERLLRESLALWEQHGPDESSNMAIVLMNLSHVIGTRKRYQEALDVALRADAALERPDPTSGTLLVRSLDYTAVLYVKLGRPNDAERYYGRALAMAREVFGPEGSVLGEIMLRYSAVLRALQRNAEAARMAREARDVISRSGEKRDTVDILALTTMQ
jgi:tetratricopeptide (TPR) repeat protein